MRRSGELDDSADVLHGWIANGGPYPVATFEATDAGELRHELERPVDECVEWCEEDGVEPWGDARARSGFTLEPGFMLRWRWQPGRRE